ncbi:PAS domain S-box protein [Robertmurraya sp. DFI.2.37]|uniref:PAS domain-containing protein n=1 Tax=Robertmurraya sp. DFI.2.37 TaxID=3031819 RepID=UPI0023D98D5C|nr:PAS domain-containing protein [Robertmurraya sp. DFI.2.37]MDF1510308.1 PAS domain S-box protein [Robertmurraya sp. DFI.2.37]
MLTVYLSLNPILIIAAVILTMMATYSALDMFSMLRSSERNRPLLFIGGTLSLSFGIWVMSFLFALDITTLSNYNLPVTFLAILVGICFTGMAFYAISLNSLTPKNLVAASFFMMSAVFSIHIIGMFGLELALTYNWVILAVTALVVFVSFYFAFWLIYDSSLAKNVWIRPLSSLIITTAVVEGHFLLLKASSITSRTDISGVTEDPFQETFLIYAILIVAVMIMSGLIGSSALVSKRLADSDSNLKDIKAALDESSIVAITDARGTITYVNDKFVEISKYTEDELIGQNHRILNSGYHPKEFFQSLWKTIGGGQVWKGEIQNRAKDGSTYWVDTTIVPFLNEKGKPYQYVSIRTDITNRKQSERKLKATLKEVNDIKFALDQSSIVAFTDEKGIITRVNDKFCEISQYTRDEIVGKDHRILNSGFHSPDFFKELWKTIGSGSVWKGEIRNKAKDGSYYWVDTTIVPFMNERGKPYQYLAIRNDITERKRTEEILHRQDKLAAVGQLAAGVAHEIRNPLTSMKGYAEFLLEDETDQQRREFVDIILDEINRVNQIVEDFMVLAKPKVVDLKEKNIIPIIKDVLSLLEFEARKKKVRMHFEANDDIVQIECDENRLKQVFLNFVKNGIEAMPNGGDITVRVHVASEQVQISIQDTGVGIPEEKLKRIGEPFYTTKKDGNGLGLMVSYKIIESHNGTVFIESELNKGTTFNIILPAHTA